MPSLSTGSALVGTAHAYKPLFHLHASMAQLKVTHGDMRLLCHRWISLCYSSSMLQPHALRVAALL